ncbi:19560_t:CDS:2, partial [Gigaspora rosea]
MDLQDCDRFVNDEGKDYVGQKDTVKQELRFIAIGNSTSETFTSSDF